MKLIYSFNHRSDLVFTFVMLRALRCAVKKLADFLLTKKKHSKRFKTGRENLACIDARQQPGPAKTKSFLLSNKFIKWVKQVWSVWL